MKEKELRLALVCYGGISLAIYMHGITKEILKAVRGSKAYHAEPDQARRQDKTFDELTHDERAGDDTEAVYFDLLRTIGNNIDIRVIVDVVAGASAGGVNGILLARALAHDLPLEHMREIWLTHADVTELLAEDARAKAWSKFVLRPVFWALTKGIGRVSALEQEVARKLSIFVRSRWFKEPFDGEKLLRILFDAMEEMGDADDSPASLLPTGHQLDLFVTLTDYYGYTHHIPIHDPPIVGEKEHRHILRFSFQKRWRSGEQISDFDRDYVPALAFAARATSSYPGAFPPAQLSEVDRLMKARGRIWARRTEFLERNFRPYRLAGHNPLMTCFLDGSVLNNKPFEPAITAIQSRGAYRDVDRRLVYIDPDPEEVGPPPDGRIPGFFGTIIGAISVIPRQEPVHDDLAWVSEFNASVRRRKTVVDAARPHIATMVTAFTRGRIGRKVAPKALREWRATANARAAIDAGFVYEGYLRLKLASVEDNACRVISRLCKFPDGSAQAVMVREAIDRWARERGIYPESGVIEPPKPGTRDERLPPWVTFLEKFDIDFRRRRLRFVIQSLNLLYARLNEPAFSALTTDRLDGLKGEFYDALETLREFDNLRFISRETAVAARELFRKDLHSLSKIGLVAQARIFAATNMERIDSLYQMLARDIDLSSVNRQVDAIVSRVTGADWPKEARRELLITYLGFPFWDQLTFSVTNWRDLGEYDEIKVNRISPEDCVAIRAGTPGSILKGVSFRHFGAFLSRRDRENDYLWGRLHAAERVIDIICDAAAAEDALKGVDKTAFKKRAFETILNSEAAHLPNSRELIDSLRAEVLRI